MNSALSDRQLTGLDESHLVAVAENHRLLPRAAAAFEALVRDARAAGFDLAIASSFRSFERQLAIFNGKAAGARAVHDDHGAPVDMTVLTARDQLWAILRFSALPGTSRHHWGTDLDVYDAAVIEPGYQIQLNPQEVAPGGLFDPLHRWLDERMARDQSHGFFRPYGVDRGGVAPERWHLSYAPVANACAGRLAAGLLRECWDASTEALLLRDEIDDALEEILARFVVVPANWCPAPWRD